MTPLIFISQKKFSDIISKPQKLTWLSSVMPVINARIDKNTADITELSDVLTETISIDPDRNEYKAIITNNNVWSVGSTGRCGMVPVQEGAESVSVTANTENNTGVAFLTTNARPQNTVPSYASGWTERVSIPAGETQSFDVPADARYLYYSKKYSDTIFTPEAIVWTRMVDIKDYVNNALGLHENPPSVTALNIVKRCRQMTDIKWTPEIDLPRFMVVQRGDLPVPDTADPQYYISTFKAGTEYTGVPYGRVNISMESYGYNFGTVGNYVGFDTFISSVSNAKSRLSEISTGSVSGHRSVIYATVCSGLVCYALDVSEVATAYIPNISGLTLIGKLNDNGTLLSDDLIKIGDVLNKYDYHTAIVTDIIRDSDGTIQMIELSDASPAGLANRNYETGQIGGLCRRKGWTREQLYDDSVWAWGSYSVYRYTGTVDYIPSQYVNVGDEFNGWRVEHFPIMPYEGQNFTFKSGYIPNNEVKLVVTLDGYGYVKVLKDGEEIQGSPFAVTKDGDSINPVTLTEISTGDYSAFLCNIVDGDVTNVSFSCKWKIIE